MSEDLEERAGGIDPIGCLIVLTMVGAFSLMGFVSCNAYSLARQKIKTEAQTQVRVQELRTIQTIAEKYGDKMSPEELRIYLQSLRVGYENQNR